MCTVSHNIPTFSLTHNGDVACFSDEVTGVPCDGEAVQSLDQFGNGGGGGGGSRNSGVFLSDLFVRGHYEQFQLRQRCPLFAVVHPVFALLTAALPNLQCALKDDLEGLERLSWRVTEMHFVWF